MEKIKLIAKGFVIGLGNIIPGVSGGALALILGIYESLLEIVNTFFKNFKKNIVLVFFLGIGFAAAILVGSIGIKAALENYELITTLFFTGLIAGSIPMFCKKINGKFNARNIIIFAIILIAMTVVVFLEGEKVAIAEPTLTNYFELVLIGIVAAATIVIPGISGTMVLMAIGYYDLLISCVATITDFSKILYNIQILLPFGIGCLIGVVTISKIISVLLSKFESQTYFAIFGFIIASLIGMIYMNIRTLDYVQLAIGLVFSILGFFGSYYLSKLEKKKEN